jgi:hypothetical protein
VIIFKHADDVDEAQIVLKTDDAGVYADDDGDDL